MVLQIKVSLQIIGASLLLLQSSAFAGDNASASQQNRHATIFYLNIRGSEVRRALADGSENTTLAHSPSRGPDGVAVDVKSKHVYWTNMGRPSADDGTLMRADLDGSNVTTIVPAGGTFTPKQLKLDLKNKKLYWSDREGMRVMRANLDGSQIETLVITGSGDIDRKDASHWCVGIAIDTQANKIYWTQKGGDNAHQGTIKRANLELRAGEDAAHRSDIEVLFSGLPEPIDLDLDVKHQRMYWTDRGDNTVSRAPMNPPVGLNPASRTDREILVRDLHEAIGITLDLKHNRMYYTALGGDVGAAELDGKNAHTLLSKQGALTGIAVVDLP